MQWITTHGYLPSHGYNYTSLAVFITKPISHVHTCSILDDQTVLELSCRTEKDRVTCLHHTTAGWSYM